MTRTKGCSGTLAESPIEGLILGIVRRLAGAAETNLHSVFVGPLVHSLRDELAAVICLDDARLTTLLAFSRQCRHHVATLQVLPNIDGQAHPRCSCRRASTHAAGGRRKADMTKSMLQMSLLARATALAWRHCADMFGLRRAYILATSLAPDTSDRPACDCLRLPSRRSITCTRRYP